MLLVFLSVTTVLADTQIGVIQSLPPVKQYDCITLKQACGACSYNNISSVSYPNSSQAMGQASMIKDGTEYDYQFCNTATLGRYIVNGFGDPNAMVETWAYDFEVTTTGNNNNYSIPLFLALGGFILLIFAFTLKNNYLGFMTGILFIILGIYTLVYGLGFVSDLYTSAIAYVSLGLGLFIFLASAYSAINQTGINLLGKDIGGDGDDDF